MIGHADRAGPLHDYCLGLVMPGERKSVEPMAAILLHFVGEGGWSDDDVLGKVREMVLPQIERYGPIEAFIIDDTSFPKKGRQDAATRMAAAIAPLGIPEVPPCARLRTKGSISVIPTTAASE